MPIEIRELVIKAFVNSSSENRGNKDGDGEVTKDIISSDAITESIEQMMEILNDKNER